MNKNHPEVIDALHRKQQEVSGRSRWRRWALPAVGGVALTLVVVALFVPVEMSVTAPGTVVPSARVKSVQHLEGGIVRELFVREGQSVREGDRLVRMELGAQGPNLEEISAKVSALHAARLRLDAEASGKAISSEMFGDDTAPMVARTEQLTHEARLLELQGQLAAARAQVEMFNGRAGEVEGFSCLSRRCSKGNENAAVLPVPVWAAPITSWPVNTTGMAWAWIGVMDS